MRGFLDGDAARALEEAIKQVEAGSAAEVVIAVRRQSATWLHFHLIAGAITAITALAYMLFSSHAFSLTSILIDPFVVATAVGAAVELWPGGKRLVTPRAARRTAVERAARATFHERGVHQTRGRTGILIYLSLVERDAAIVPDAEAAATWSSESRDRARDAIAAAIPRGGAAVARVITGCGRELAVAMPRADDDINELPDAVDVHHRRGKR